MSSLPTIGDCLAYGARRLAEAGVPEPRREARLILAHALGIEPVTVAGYPERSVPDAAAFRGMVARRADREPLSHITGRREFWSLEFEVTAATLDPRPDSETLIEAALGAIADRAAPLSVVDFGTGTGCLLLALLSELPNATGLGVDQDQGALAVATRNAARLGMASRAQFAAGDWGGALAEPFDVILSNPPYIATAEIDGLQREVARHEPRRALDGGPDGLDCYRALSRDVARLLRRTGFAMIEFGAGQGPSVVQIMEAQGLVGKGFHGDLGGHDRCAEIRKQ